LALQLARDRRFKKLGLAVKVAPAASRAEAARVTRRLRRPKRKRR